MKLSIERSFFIQDTLKVAQALLGMKLSTRINGHVTSGQIVEVEAYRGDKDEASHSFRGKTKRSEVMFREGGYCYVYLIYGMYHCVNIVTEKEDLGCAVLIRALEPLDGIETMRKRRKLTQSKVHYLTNGPGKLCQALGIDKKLSGEDFLNSSRISLSSYKKIKKSQILSGPRIGITKSTHFNWRFYLKDNPWVSK